MRAAIGALALLLMAAAPGQAQDTPKAKANALLVHAIDAAEQAEQADDAGRRLELLDQAQARIQQIRRKYAGTDLAVKLATGQTIGDFDPGEIATRREAAFADACLDDPSPECLQPLADRLTEINDKLETTSLQLRKTRAKLDQTETRAAQRKVELAKLDKEVDKLRAALERVQDKHMAAEDEANDLREKLQSRRRRIDNLTERLNKQLAEDIDALARYRSEFFGRLRESIGSRDGVRIVGHRFVIGADHLFDSGSAELTSSGRDILDRVSTTLGNVAAKVPQDIDWIVRIASHTDRRPIQTAKYPSNWELSATRSIAVVKDMIDNGTLAQQLVAVGYADNYPIAESGTEGAMQINRRIEIKLSEM
ncbi:OmpA family protein [Rhodovibrio sodomensis]|nr:OmpA family protein [Rhodovibrio sodomensis]